MLNNEELKAKLASLRTSLDEIESMISGEENAEGETEQPEEDINSEEVSAAEKTGEDAEKSAGSPAGTKVVIGIGKKKMPDMLSRMYK